MILSRLGGDAPAPSSTVSSGAAADVARRTPSDFYVDYRLNVILAQPANHGAAPRRNVS